MSQFFKLQNYEIFRPDSSLVKLRFGLSLEQFHPGLVPLYLRFCLTLSLEFNFRPEPQMRNKLDMSGRHRLQPCIPQGVYKSVKNTGGSTIFGSRPRVLPFVHKI